MGYAAGYRLLKGLYNIHYIRMQAGTLENGIESTGFEGDIYKTLYEQKVALCLQKAAPEELSLLSGLIRLISLVNHLYRGC